jgi:hypothetical protein
MPLTFAWKKGHGHAFTYSHMIVFLQSFTRSTQTQITIDYIPGSINPADSLSRIQHTPPPLLHVTKVGQNSVTDNEGGQWQMGRAAKEAQSGFFPRITQKCSHV